MSLYYKKFHDRLLFFFCSRFKYLQFWLNINQFNKSHRNVTIKGKTLRLLTDLSTNLVDSIFCIIFYNKSNILHQMMTVETEKYDYNNGLKKVKEASQTFPKGSGVYKFLDSYKNPLYIGKAKNLKKRISSYLNIGKHTKRTVQISHNKS